jgi:hypothetical protein
VKRAAVLALFVAGCGSAAPRDAAPQPVRPAPIVAAPPAPSRAVGSDQPMIPTSAPAPREKPLAPADFAGRWESEAGDCGLGGVLDLKLAGGTYVLGFAVTVDGPYAVRGTKLVSGTDAVQDANEFSIEGDVMTVRIADEPDSVRRRVGDAVPGAPPIVGVWKYGHYVGTTAFERYRADGRMEFRLPMPALEQGRWAVSQDDGRLVFETAAGLQFMDARRNGDVLTLSTGGGAPDTYRLVERWYEFPMDVADIAKAANLLNVALPTEK